MRTQHAFRVWTPIGLAAALMMGLVACGGGGGDPGPQMRPVEVTLANRDNVAHAAAIAMVGVGSTAAGGVTPNSVAAPGKTAQTLQVGGHAVSALLPAPVQQRLHQWLVASRLRQQLAADGMKHALAVYGPDTTGCTFGGTTSLTFNDADNNDDLSAGDSITMVFSACRDTPDTRMDGSSTLVITAVTPGQFSSFAARMTMSDLAMATSEHTVTMNGAMLFSYAQTSFSTERLSVTVETALSVNVQGGPAPDTVTMQPGYSEVALYDMNAAPPEGGVPGRTTVTSNGTVQSNTLNGTFTVSTVNPLVGYDVDPFPRSGMVMVQGAKGALRMTVLSSSQVLMELDADGNGQYENSSTVAWTWLI